MHRWLLSALLVYAFLPAFSADQNPFLGVRIDARTTGRVSTFGLLVSEILPQSTAQAMDVRTGDYLRSIDGRSMTCDADLADWVRSRAIGSRVVVGVSRLQNGVWAEVSLQGLMLAQSAATTQVLASAPKLQAPPAVATPYRSGRYSPPVAENGDARGADNDGDGRVESVHVNGYYRKDGTYVRGHYRAKPRK